MEIPWLGWSQNFRCSGWWLAGDPGVLTGLTVVRSSMGVFPSFEVIPAVDLEDGEVVQLVQGKRGTGSRYGDPVAAARRWVDADASTLHIVDLDGAFDGERRNAEFVKRIIDEIPVSVQLGGGIRSETDAESLLELGIDRVILGTLAIENPEVVDSLSASYPEGVMVSLDAKAGSVVVSGWQEDTGLDPVAAAVRYEELGAAAILFTNVDVEGQLAGVNPTPVRELADSVSIPIVASGGVSSVADITALHSAGASAVVVGTALYEDRFTLEDAYTAIRE